MFVDIWVVLAAAAVVGLCAVWNRKAGRQEGASDILNLLYVEKVINIKNGMIIPGTKRLANQAFSLDNAE